MKNLQKLQYLIASVLIAGFFLGISSIWPVTSGQAATQDEFTEFQFYRATPIAADGCSQAVNARINTKAQVQLVVAMPTPNTTTFKLYHSNDNSNWWAGTPVASSVATNTSVGVEVGNYNVFTKLCADVTNTSTLTITSRTLFKP